MPRRPSTAKLVAALKEHALAYPEAWEDHPWGESVIKVRKKVFVFMGEGGLSVKLPDSRDFALSFPGAEPTGYGLGKAGWVSIALDGGDVPPPDLLEDWIEESYRAVAPKRLVAALDALGAPGDGAA
ncbi:MAG: MmcQ/YjbR family DNA-binding protein [Chloroflexi bacterium]|nr:MmcQ/YjbR family DNA-binding protein [Chloroflexota bacterium]